MDACIDRYLWALYQRTAKEDTIKVQERRAVTVKRKGKMVTVMRSFTKLVDEDFGWKDPKAADHAKMSLMDYVIGGMDRSFKQKLFRTLLAAEAAGLSPGITSAFRDDYRQSIASGLKAASDRSYHGGSTRGGYGHGMAADIVSTKGDNRAQRWVTTEALWKWVDANGKALGRMSARSTARNISRSVALRPTPRSSLTPGRGRCARSRAPGRRKRRPRASRRSRPGRRSRRSPPRSGRPEAAARSYFPDVGSGTRRISVDPASCVRTSTAKTVSTESRTAASIAAPLARCAAISPVRRSPVP
jgi:hypothetical protein